MPTIVRFRLIDLNLSKDQLRIRSLPAEEFFWLTNVYVELAIVMVAYAAANPAHQRHAGASLMIVPACTRRASTDECTPEFALLHSHFFASGQSGLGGPNASVPEIVVRIL